ncbi:MAG: hypothetical protein KDI07_22540 [Anaerolineae bacterium]|nr:hypothetical protein [Anaerolineae bacterium]MCB0236605.1 hypothetical protein [Anaerolineae bacterium]MCB0241548.1 hypothetical protein [Anaerolineae bacterium]MCB0251366.1 hypothetical protein [Anaerolineae bacterium]
MLLGELASHILIDPRKLTDYALAPEAPRGRHKALVFERVLGYTLDDWQHLLSQIEARAPAAEARPHNADRHGRRYTADLLITGANGRQAIVRTGWILRPEEDVLRLVTLWIEE